MQHLHALWRARGFIAGSVQREFSGRYQSSLLGAGWAIITPLAMVLVYLLVFSQVMQARLPGRTGAMDYGIYLCAGVLVWGFFAEILNRSTTMFLDNAGLLKKMNFPRVCLPVIVVVNASMNFTIVFLLFLALLLLTGHFPGRYVLALPALMLILGAFACSLGTVMGMLNVFFRDVGQALGVILQVWFWMTPVVYPVSILPRAIEPVVLANPVTPVVSAMQRLALGAGWPQWDQLLAPTVVALFASALAFALFRRHAHEIVDEL
jgi:lipopolysaccharide transport system permease protein